MDFSETDIEWAIEHNAFYWRPSLSKALRWLPGINAQTTKRRLEDELHRRAMATDATGRDRSLDDIGELFLRDDYNNARVSPCGAALLIRLFEQGRLDATIARRAGAGADLDALKAYSTSAAVQRQKAIDYLTDCLVVQHAVDDPSSARPDAFTYALLNEIFYRHHGGGSGMLRVGGVVVRKHLSGPFPAEGGRGKVFHARFLWTDPTTLEVRSVERGMSLVRTEQNQARRPVGQK